MPILAPTKSPTGVPLEYHRLIKAEQDFERGFGLLGVVSYVSEDDFLRGMPSACAWQHSVGLDAFVGDGQRSTLEQVLISAPHLPFFGGQVVVDNANTLEASKERAWTRVKVDRARAESGNFTYDGGDYQIDIIRVNGAVQLASLAKMGAQPYSVTWTLTDNTTRTLNADQTIAMGVALGRKIDSIYAKGRALRELISSATTLEDASGVLWSSYRDEAPYSKIVGGV